MSDKTTAAFVAAGKGQKGTPTAHAVAAAKTGAAFRAASEASRNIGAPTPSSRPTAEQRRAKEWAKLHRDYKRAHAKVAAAAARTAAIFAEEARLKKAEAARKRSALVRLGKVVKL